MEYGVFGLVMVLAGFVQAVTGMGYGMLCMSVLTFLFPYVPLMLALKVLTITFSLPVMFRQREKIQWRILLVPVLFSIPGYYMAAGMLRWVGERELKVFLGIMVMLMALFNLLWRSPIRMRATVAKGAFFGLITGFFAGSSSVAGPPMAMYYLNTEKLAEDKDSYYATTIMTFQLISIYQFILAGIGGNISADIWKYVWMGLPPTLLGIWAGQKLFYRVDAKRIRQLACLFMAAAGFVLTIVNLRG